MSVNTTISCNWPSAKALVGDIHGDKLNVTDIVAQCGSVCELAFESKRTEIFGEGIIISLFLQAALFSTIGILLPGIIFFLNKRSKEKVAPSTILLRKIRELLLESGFFTIVSFYVAVIAASRQTAGFSIMELVYISSLMEFQFWCVWGVSLAQSADNTLNKTETSPKWQSFYHALVVAKIALSIFVVKIPHHDLYKTLAKECHKQHQFISALSSVITDGEAAKWSFIGMGIGVGIMVLIFLFLACSGYAPAPLKRWCKMLWRSIPSWIKNSFETWFNFFMLAMFSQNIVLNFFMLLQKRSLVIQASGVQSAGEQWGYGQTTAVLLWVPFFYSALKETIKYTRNPPQPEIQAELKSSESEKYPPPPPPAAVNFSYPHPKPPPPPLSTAMMPPPYEHPHSASKSTETIEVRTDDLEANGIRRTSSGQRE